MLYGPDGLGWNRPATTATNPASAPPKTGTNAPDFKQAVSNAQAATHTYASSRGQNDLNIAEQDWGIVEAIIQDQYRQAYASNDLNAPKKLDQEYGKYLQDQGNDTSIYNRFLHDAQNEVEGESPALRSAYHQEYDAYSKLQNESTSWSTYQTDATNVVQADMGVQLAQMFPAVIDGVYTVDQIVQAKSALDKANPQAAASADYVGDQMEVSAYLASNFHGLKLTPAEQQLKGIDPVTLAFLKADGITVTGTTKDQPLSNEMLQFAEDNPALFAYMQINHVSFSEVTGIKGGTITPANAASHGLYQLASGKYLEITVNDNPYAANKVNPQDISSAYDYYSTANYRGQITTPPLAAVASTILPDLSINADTLKNNQSLATLMGATDRVRYHWAGTQLQMLMSKAVPATGQNAGGYLANTINPFLTRQLNGFFFDPTDKTAVGRTNFWSNTVMPLLQPYEKAALGATFQKGNGQGNAATDGKYLQQVLSGAAPEVAKMLIGLVEGQVNKLTLYGNDPRVQSLLYGLSEAAQIADQASGTAPGKQGPEAKQIAGWIRSLPENQLGEADATLHDITANFGYSDLPDALASKYAGTADATIIQDGEQEYEQTVQQQIGAAAYHAFRNNEKSILKNYFNQFSNTPDIGIKIKASDTSALRSGIIASLGWTPGKLTAIQKRTVDLDMSWISMEAGADGTVTILPYLFVSQMVGLESGVFFEVTNDHKDNRHNRQPSMVLQGGFWVPSNQQPSKVLIDGRAAQTALEMDPDADAHAGSVDVKWHYGSFSDFQLNNDLYQGGTIYTLTNNKVTVGADGDVEWTAAASSRADVWKDVRGWVDVGVGLAGVFAAPFTGGASLVLAAGWATIEAALQYDDFASHGEHFGWSNPNAHSAIEGDSMVAANWLILGFGTGASFLERDAVETLADGTTVGEAGDASAARAGTVRTSVDDLNLENDNIAEGFTATLKKLGWTEGNEIQISQDALDRGSEYVRKANNLRVGEKVVNRLFMAYGTYQTAQTLASLAANWRSMSWSERAQAALNVGMGVFPFFAEAIAGSHSDNVRRSAKSGTANGVNAVIRAAHSDYIPADGPRAAGLVTPIDDGSFENTVGDIYRTPGRGVEPMVRHSPRSVPAEGGPGNTDEEDPPTRPIPRSRGFRRFPASSTDGVDIATAKLIRRRDASLRRGFVVAADGAAEAAGPGAEDVSLSPAAIIEGTVRNKWSYWISGEGAPAKALVAKRVIVRGRDDFAAYGKIVRASKDAIGFQKGIHKAKEQSLIVILDTHESPQVLPHEILHRYTAREFITVLTRLTVDPNNPHSNLMEGATEFLTSMLTPDAPRSYPRETEIARRVFETINGGKEVFYRTFFRGELGPIGAFMNAALNIPGVSYRPLKGPGSGRPSERTKAQMAMATPSGGAPPEPGAPASLGVTGAPAAEENPPTPIPSPSEGFSRFPASSTDGVDAATAELIRRRDASLQRGFVVAADGEAEAAGPGAGDVSLSPAAIIEGTVRDKWSDWISGEGASAEPSVAKRVIVLGSEDFIKYAEIVRASKNVLAFRRGIHSTKEQSLIVVLDTKESPQVLTHEILHHYTAKEFIKWARTLGVNNDPYSNLVEGATEFLASMLTPDAPRFYPEVTEVARKVFKRIGEQVFYRAFFWGERDAIRKFMKAAEIMPGVGLVIPGLMSIKMTGPGSGGS
jgi:hypothetical protein